MDNSPRLKRAFIDNRYARITNTNDADICIEHVKELTISLFKQTTGNRKDKQSGVTGRLDYLFQRFGTKLEMIDIGNICTQSSHFHVHQHLVENQKEKGYTLTPEQIDRLNVKIHS